MLRGAFSGAPQQTAAPAMEPVPPRLALPSLRALLAAPRLCALTDLTAGSHMQLLHTLRDRAMALTPKGLPVEGCSLLCRILTALKACFHALRCPPASSTH